MIKRVALLLLISCSLHAKTPQYELSICAIFRNEARFLKEWIEYHRMVGVDHFYLYDNLSTDQYQEVLDPYVKKGIVEIFSWPFENSSSEEWWAIQCQAYNNCLKKKSHKTRWLAFIDTDEYIVSKKRKPLPSVLSKYKKYGGVSINWQMYGTSNIKKIEDGELMMEKLVYKMKEDHSHNTHIKSIVQPKRTTSTHIHSARYTNGYYPVNEKKEKLDEIMGVSPYVSVEKLMIVHYSERDEEYFYNVKAPLRQQRYPEGEAPEFHPHKEFNEVYDPFMLRFVPELKKRMRKEP